MSDRFYPTGQYVPTAPRTNSYIPSAYSTRSDGNLGTSFYDVLNRQQMTAPQLKAIEAPIQQTVNRIPQNYSLPQGTTVIPLPETTTETVVEVDPAMADMLKFMPQNHPQGEELHQIMRDNYNQFQSMQNEQGSGVTPYQTAVITTQPVQSAPADNYTFPTPTSAFNSVLAQDFQDSNRVIPVGMTQSSPQAVAAATPTNNMEDFTPQMIAMRQDATSQVQSPQQRVPLTQVEMDMIQSQVQQPLENSEEKGPIEAFGSFFMNIFSGITFGLIHPKNETPPQGIERAAYPFKKILWDAPKDLVVNVPMGVYRSAGKAINNKEENEQTSDNTASEQKSTTHFRSRMLRRNFYT